MVLGELLSRFCDVESFFLMGLRAGEDISGVADAAERKLLNADLFCCAENMLFTISCNRDSDLDGLMTLGTF